MFSTSDYLYMHINYFSLNVLHILTLSYNSSVVLSPVTFSDLENNFAKYVSVILRQGFSLAQF